MNVKVFNCKRDDLIIRGHIYIPDDDTSLLMTVILSHSFGSSEAETKPYAEYLANHGICCFTYNFCGGTLGPIPQDIEKSDGDFSQMTIESEMADLVTIIQYAKKQKFVDTQNIILAGGSQGGFISARVAAKIADEIKMLIMLYPALCIPQDSWKGQMLFFKFDPKNVPDFIETDAMPDLRLNGEYVKQSQKIDIYDELQSYPGKVVIIHGTKDEVVDFSFAQKLVDVRPDTILVTMDGASHGFRGEAQNHAKEFLLKAVSGNL